MQGKDVSEQEAAGELSAGIDVSKAWLDVHVLPSGERLRAANDRAGIAMLKRWLERRRVRLVALEATGKWHRGLHRSLDATGIATAVVDPLKARRFAQAGGILAKTDRLDARVLALFARMMNPTVRPPPPVALETLAELVHGRASAVEERTALKNQRSTATTALLRRQLDRRIAALGADIAALEHEIEASIAADPTLARRRAILTSVPGLGATTAAVLLADLAELGTCTRSQIALLAGLAPIADDSGQRHGERRIRGGRASVRRTLYLAALSAARANPDLAAFRRRLKDKAKTPKAILIAVARKLVVLANTLIAENRTWQTNPPPA